jgi:hypothetical protein
MRGGTTMFDETYKGMALDIFDMYGIVDIRSTQSNRSAQVLFADNEWQVHLYWTENGELNKHFEILTINNKPGAEILGKDWVTLGTH